MSTKFEQLLDLLVNEEMDKANDLFHEIVVDKSREIYENLIAEEDDETEESSEMDEESVDEADELDDDAVEENMDQEDAYEANSFDQNDDDATGQLGQEIGSDDEEGDAEFGDDESSEDSAIMDIKNAIQELEAAFAELEQAHGGDDGAEMGFGDEEGSDDEFGAEEEPEDEMMGRPAFEGRRVTREYVEKVGNDWEKNSQKTQGQYAGAGSGEKDGSPVEGRSPVASGKNKPGPAGVNARNLNQSHTGVGEMTGTSPNAKVGGFLKHPQDMKTGNQNVPGGKVSVKGLSKVANGHGAEKKGAGPGPVGSGKGDNAGQTSDANGSKQFLPQYK